MNRRKSLLGIAISLLATAGLVSGCVFDSSAPDLRPPPPREYAPLDSPGRLLGNLSLSYERQDIDRYLEILAPEFQFVFTPHEESSCDSGRWDAWQDSLATAAMFEDPRLVDLEVSIHHGSPEPATEIDLDGTWRVRTSGVEVLLILDDDNSMFATGDIHEFYFRPGSADAGEDPERWFLVEWRDLSDRTPTRAPEPGPDAVIPVSWWEIKCGYASWVGPAAME